MADYYLTDPQTGGDNIIRTEDGVCIPPDMANRDYAKYQQWLIAGNTPDPYVPPPTPEPAPTPEQTILFDHENRVRALEGQPPLTVEDFVAGAATPAPAPAKRRKGA